MALACFHCQLWKSFVKEQKQPSQIEMSRCRPWDIFHIFFFIFLGPFRDSIIVGPFHNFTIVALFIILVASHSLGLVIWDLFMAEGRQ